MKIAPPTARSAHADAAVAARETEPTTADTILAFLLPSVFCDAIAWATTSSEAAASMHSAQILSSMSTGFPQIRHEVIWSGGIGMPSPPIGLCMEPHLSQIFRYGPSS